MKGINFLCVSIFVFILINFDAKSQQYEEQDSSISNKVFKLGEITITALQEKSIIKAEENEQFNRLDVARSLDLLPSITLNNNGARNEATVYLRGYDLRQVPVYLDGIPIYVPYDGYLDLARFTIFDLSEIDISKGFSSILYGPNTLGGAINLITRKPKNKIEVTALAGVMSGDGYKGSVNIGTNLNKIYLQGGFSSLQQKYYPLSHDFDSVKTENGKARDNSYREDTKATIKMGFTPNKHDEYSISYIYQHGEKGNPIYTGNDPSIKVRYWQWPLWDKESIYFISKTTIRDKNYVKTRLFYDKFKNQLNSFDDATYTTQTKPYAFQSFYNDETMGASVETGTEFIPKNKLKLSVHLKNDKHSEHNLNEPIRHFQDNTFSFGVEDNFEWNNKLMVIPGISYNIRQSIVAEDYNATTKTISNFPNNHSNAFNIQIGVYYNFTAKQRISAIIAQKTRFATMKDRYSYKMGTAIPNVDLKPENALNYEFAYNGVFFEKLQVKPAVFYSRISDVIQNVYNVLPGKTQMQNAGNAEFIGAELSTTYDMAKNIKANLNYTYIERHNLTHPELKFTDVPNHKIMLSLCYKPLEQIEIVLSEEYNSERYSTSYGNKTSEFTLFNFRVAGKVWKYLYLEVGIDNVFDKNYYLSEGYPEQGRNFYGSLIYKFN
ncbi:MAG: TonB-dependent receptor [Bacteroidales bacterium]|nr:TonB-dependent receptor [Bacteroidales bacterium]